MYDYTSNNAGGTRRIKYDKILSYFTLLGANKILRNISTRLLFIREFFLYAKYGSSVLNLKIIKNYRVYTYECLKKIRFFPIIIYIYILSFFVLPYRIIEAKHVFKAKKQKKIGGEVHLFQGNFTSGGRTQGWNVNSAKDRQDLRRGICKLRRYVQLSARGKKSISRNLKGKAGANAGASSWPD